MRYFGIKTPPREDGERIIWWISNTEHESWMAFFTHPSDQRERNAHRTPIAEAISAYKAIGYECVALDVTEVPNACGEPGHTDPGKD